MEILSSRVAGAEQDKRVPRMPGLDEVEKAETYSEKHKSSVNEEEELNRFQLATPTSLQRPTVSETCSFLTCLSIFFPSTICLCVLV